ncbi:MAG: hypothetical protein KAJ79_02380, partial [Candidatus Omnitrophica bacterium]|nr:hypothetical protein [Candidatus Omnitrophota bacterium]
MSAPFMPLSQPMTGFMNFGSSNPNTQIHYLPVNHENPESVVHIASKINEIDGPIILVKEAVTVATTNNIDYTLTQGLYAQMLQGGDINKYAQAYEQEQSNSIPKSVKYTVNAVSSSANSYNQALSELISSNRDKIKQVVVEQPMNYEFVKTGNDLIKMAVNEYNLGNTGKAMELFKNGLIQFKDLINERDDFRLNEIDKLVKANPDSSIVVELGQMHNLDKMLKENNFNINVADRTPSFAILANQILYNDLQDIKTLQRQETLIAALEQLSGLKEEGFDFDKGILSSSSSAIQHISLTDYVSSFSDQNLEENQPRIIEDIQDISFSFEQNPVILRDSGINFAIEWQVPVEKTASLANINFQQEIISPITTSYTNFISSVFNYDMGMMASNPISMLDGGLDKLEMEDLLKTMKEATLAGKLFPLETLIDFTATLKKTEGSILEEGQTVLALQRDYYKKKIFDFFGRHLRLISVTGDNITPKLKNDLSLQKFSENVLFLITKETLPVEVVRQKLDYYINLRQLGIMKAINSNVGNEQLSVDSNILKGVEEGIIRSIKEGTVNFSRNIFRNAFASSQNALAMKVDGLFGENGLWNGLSRLARKQELTKIIEYPSDSLLNDYIILFEKQTGNIPKGLVSIAKPQTTYYEGLTKGLVGIAKSKLQTTHYEGLINRIISSYDNKKLSGNEINIELGKVHTLLDDFIGKNYFGDELQKAHKQSIGQAISLVAKSQGINYVDINIAADGGTLKSKLPTLTALGKEVIGRINGNTRNILEINYFPVVHSVEQNFIKMLPKLDEIVFNSNGRKINLYKEEISSTIEDYKLRQNFYDILLAEGLVPAREYLIRGLDEYRTELTLETFNSENRTDARMSEFASYQDSFLKWIDENRSVINKIIIEPPLEKNINFIKDLDDLQHQISFSSGDSNSQLYKIESMLDYIKKSIEKRDSLRLSQMQPLIEENPDVINIIELGATHTLDNTLKNLYPGTKVFNPQGFNNLYNKVVRNDLLGKKTWFRDIRLMLSSGFLNSKIVEKTNRIKDVLGKKENNLPDLSRLTDLNKMLESQAAFRVDFLKKASMRKVGPFDLDEPKFTASQLVNSPEMRKKVTDYVLKQLKNKQNINKRLRNNLDLEGDIRPADILAKVLELSELNGILSLTESKDIYFKLSGLHLGVRGDLKVLETDIKLFGVKLGHSILDEKPGIVSQFVDINEDKLDKILLEVGKESIKFSENEFVSSVKGSIDFPALQNTGKPIDFDEVSPTLVELDGGKKLKTTPQNEATDTGLQKAITDATRRMAKEKKPIKLIFGNGKGIEVPSSSKIKTPKLQLPIEVKKFESVIKQLKGKISLDLFVNRMVHSDGLSMVTTPVDALDFIQSHPVETLNFAQENKLIHMNTKLPVKKELALSLINTAFPEIGDSDVSILNLSKADGGMKGI